MPDRNQVLAPMLSVNEPEAQVSVVHVAVGGSVKAGDLLFTLETTKASFEVHSEADGYAGRILVVAGQMVTAGQLLAEISSEAPGAPQLETMEPPSAEPEGLLITAKAREAAARLGVELGRLPVGSLVTEDLVKEIWSSGRRASEAPADRGTPLQPAFDANQLVILGAGGHAKTIIDLVRQSQQYDLAGLVAEPLPVESEVLGVRVLGGYEVLEELWARGIRLMANGVGGLSRNRVRYELFQKMAEHGFGFPRLVHRGATVEPSARIQGGVQVFGAAFVGSAAQIGFGAIVNTGAVVSHDCVIGDFAHLTPGVVLAGSVHVDTGALVGMGVTTAVGVRIGEWARIGNGARITRDVPAHGIVQAGSTW